MSSCRGLIAPVLILGLAPCPMERPATAIHRGASTTPITQPVAASAGGGCSRSEAPAISPAVVATDRGLVQGTTEGATYAFRGIPYAAPPVGELRWRPPQRAGCWEGVRPAMSFASSCAQLSALTGSTQAWFGSEDCLYLNVWSPVVREAGDRLPVVFFIHGGGNTRGGANFITFGANIYDGRHLAEAGRVIVVAINYRLHYLGFLAHASLTSESPDGTSGNYGSLDQIAALQWVRRNIENFGGNPDRVLVFGQSAGARNACVLATSPLTRGLMAAAGMISGNCENIPSLDRMQASGNSYVRNLGCAEAADVPACLRGKPLQDVILGAVREPLVPGGFQLGPNVDGHLLVQQPLEALRGPHHNHVPWLISSAADEVANALLPALWSAPVTSAAQYEVAIRGLFDDAMADDVLTAYPAAAFSTPRTTLIRVLTDSFLVCPARRMARTAALWDEPVWRAFYNHTYSNGPLAPLHAAHITDMPFWFDNLTLPDFAPSASEAALGATMSAFLTSFAATGNPNHPGGPLWPRYDPMADSHLVLDDVIAADRGVRTAPCDFWDAHPLTR